MSVMPGSGNWVDTHVHVFERRLPFVAGRRYEPDYDATPENLSREMSAAGIAKAVLVQPSFLGTDNHYLLDAIAAAPQSFAGIAVIDPATGIDELGALKRAGVVGVRLNCIGQPSPDLRQGEYRVMADRFGEIGLVLQIQAEGGHWLSVAPALGDLPCAVLVDHFGRTPAGMTSGGFEALLSAAAATENVWFKFSGPYRFPEAEADRCADAILDAIGHDRIVWGSDWPWTQFESQHSYGETLRWLDRWVGDAGERQRILSDNPARLFGFNSQ
jgi:predicted TIM-barrel fold metal-dependent hydrolase